MTVRFTRRAFVGAAAATTLAAPTVLRAAEPLKIRCSLDTAPQPSAQRLDRRLSRQAREGVGRRDQERGVPLRPAVRRPQCRQGAAAGPGRDGVARRLDADRPGARLRHGASCRTSTAVPLDVTHKATDGKPGELHQQAARGQAAAATCSARGSISATRTGTATKTPIDKLADLKGLKIRSPGGAGITWRIKFVGGIANTTAWPNVPLALSQGTFDAFVSTDESCTLGQAVGGGREVLLRRPPVHGPVHPDDRPAPSGASCRPTSRR